MSDTAFEDELLADTSGRQKTGTHTYRKQGHALII